ncbi:MAG: lysozyme [Candidatus Binataceae bacterium]
MPALSDSISSAVGDPKEVESSSVSDRDVATVQGLLNAQIIKDNRSDRLLDITGRMNDDTVKAIIEFQRRRGFPQSGAIEPRDNTICALIRFDRPCYMHASYGIIDFIEHEEGFSPILYYTDGADNTTIGYGHLVHPGKINPKDPHEEPFKNGIDRQHATDLLHDDLEQAEKPICELVEVPLTQNQFNALASLVFNIGGEAFKNSTLLKLLNAGDYHKAAMEFPRWDKVHVHGQARTSSDLLRRRNGELGFFLRR